MKKTSNYDQFTFIEGNRSINEGHVKKLEASILRNNLLHLNPIIVNEKMQVIDGQHRLEVCRRNDIDVWYVVGSREELDEVIDLNTATRKWGMNEYLESHISRGNQHYSKLKSFCEEYDLPLMVGAGLLANVHGGGSRRKFAEDFKLGLFKSTHPGSGEFVAGVLRDVKKFMDAGVWRTRDFMDAVIYLFSEKMVERKRFVHKIELYGSMLVRRAGRQDYLRDLEQVYNFRQQGELARFF